MRALLEASRHDESAFAELQDRLSSDLAFGTAGMRAPMGPGFSRINPVTVQLITQVAGTVGWQADRLAGCGRLPVQAGRGPRLDGGCWP